MKSTKEEIIHAVGLWVLRLALLVGAIVLACFDKNEAAATCSFALVASF